MPPKTGTLSSLKVDFKAEVMSALLAFEKLKSSFLTLFDSFYILY